MAGIVETQMIRARVVELIDVVHFSAKKTIEVIQSEFGIRYRLRELHALYVEAHLGY